MVRVELAVKVRDIPAAAGEAKVGRSDGGGSGGDGALHLQRLPTCWSPTLARARA